MHSPATPHHDARVRRPGPPHPLCSARSATQPHRHRHRRHKGRICRPGCTYRRLTRQSCGFLVGRDPRRVIFVKESCGNLADFLTHSPRSIVLVHRHESLQENTQEALLKAFGRCYETRHCIVKLLPSVVVALLHVPPADILRTDVVCTLCDGYIYARDGEWATPPRCRSRGFRARGLLARQLTPVTVAPVLWTCSTRLRSFREGGAGPSRRPFRQRSSRLPITLEAVGAGGAGSARSLDRGPR